MIRRAAILLAVPVVLAAVVAVPLGLWRGEYQWLCAAVAVGLTVPPGLVAFVATERMAQTSPYGRVTGMFLGSFVRLVAGFGGAVLVFLLARPTFHADPLSFGLWVLGLYLTTLALEVALLSREQAGGPLGRTA